MKKQKKELDPTQLAPSMIDPEKTGVFGMYMAGWTAADIEAETGIRADKVRQWAHRESWNEQKKAFEEAYAKKHPPSEQPLVKAVVNARKGDLKKKFVENMGEIAAEDSEAWKDMQPQERLIVAPAIAALGSLHRKTFELDKEAEAQERGHISLQFLLSADQPGQVRVLEPSKVKEIEPAKENG